ncbi:MAG: tetratricopeptide repeat-containing sensor histidine kinase, partial [Bacteroidota bacterium]
MVRAFPVIWSIIFNICLGLFFPFLSKGQNQQIADSLIIELKNIKVQDSVKYQILLDISFNHSDPAVKLSYAQQLYNMAKEQSDLLWTYRGLYNVGIAYRLMGNLTQAIDAYFRCAEIAEKLGLNDKLGEVYNELANVYSVDGNHSNSVKFYNKSIVILREEEDSLLLAAALMNAGDEYFNADKLDSALLLFEESGQIFSLLDYPVGNAYNLGNIGLVYAKQNKHDQAESNLFEASKILEESGDRYPVAVYDTYMADIYFQKGDLKRALYYATKSYDVSIELGLKEQIRDASLKLSELYQQNEDFENAYSYQSQYLAYRDSINNEETIRKMADLRTEYEVSQKQVEIDLLESQQLIQYVVSASMAVVILLLAFLAFVYYRNNKRRQLTNQLLQEQKEEIEAQRDQLEALNETREKFLSIVSHDLLGPVNSFKGFSTLIKFSLEDNNIEELKELNVQFDKSVNNLSTLLTNLLDWTVTQRGTIPYKPQKLDLQDIANELIILFENMAAAKEITLESSIDTTTYLWVDLNSTKTILRNLVSNALKFTTAGGTIKLSVNISNDIAA